MKKWLFLLFFIPAALWGETTIIRPYPTVTEVDGVPSKRYSLLKFPNGSLDDKTSYYIILSSAFVSNIGTATFSDGSTQNTSAGIFISSYPDCPCSTITISGIPSFREAEVTFFSSGTNTATDIVFTFNNELADEPAYSTQRMHYLAGAGPTTTSTSNAVYFNPQNLDRINTRNFRIDIFGNSGDNMKTGTFQTTVSSKSNNQPVTVSGSFLWNVYGTTITSISVFPYRTVNNNFRGGPLFLGSTWLKFRSKD